MELFWLKSPRENTPHGDLYVPHDLDRSWGTVSMWIYAVTPPSTVKVAPVMYLPDSPARWPTMAATSAAVP